MRLTKDLKTPHDDTTYADELINVVDKENIVLTKLKHYENIEEEFAIDLITLLEVLFYKRTYVEKWDTSVIAEGCIFTTDLYEFVKNYGKTWALTKEELL